MKKNPSKLGEVITPATNVCKYQNKMELYKSCIYKKTHNCA